MSTLGAGCMTARGLDISLAALQRQDPYIIHIVDVASQVALYTFNSKVNEWEKTDVEGTLFVYTRLASPRHGFTIMNRLSMDNLTEPITKDLDFQLQDPFLLYRNARLCIYGIWFYDKDDCQRVAQLLRRVVRQEQQWQMEQQCVCVSPQPLHSDAKSVDILQMLNKARHEYDKGKSSSEPKEIGSGDVIHGNPHLIKPIPVKHTPQGEGSYHSLAPLFRPPQVRTSVECVGVARPPVARSLSYDDAAQAAGGGGASENPTQQCPAIQKLMSGQRGVAPLQPLSEWPERLGGGACANGEREFQKQTSGCGHGGRGQLSPSELLQRLQQLQEPEPTTHTHILLPQVVSPLLLSPSVFQSKPSSSGPDPLPCLSRAQLQAALLHLLRNDSSFLDSIYEAYISRVTEPAKPL